MSVLIPQKFIAVVAQVLNAAVNVSLQIRKPDWCELVSITLPEDFSEDAEAVHICAVRARVKKRGEIARVYFNLKDRRFLLAPISNAVRVAVEPLSVSGYQFIVHNTFEGLEIRFANNGQVDSWLHDFARSLEA